MEWWLILLLFCTILLVFLLLSMPVAFAFMLANFAMVIAVMGLKAGPYQMIVNMFDSLTIFTLAPIPLFILMGEMLFHSGMAFRALNAMSIILGKIPGRLSILANLSGAVFAALSGSPISNTAMLGSLLVPEMERRGYSKLLALGPIMAAGGVAMIIPPSTLSVLFGTFAQISIAKILIAGFIPGILLVISYITYIVGSCILNPELAPAYEVKETAFMEKAKSFVTGIFPLGVILFIVTGTIFIGVATPTEAAALGVVCSILLTILYGQFKMTLLKKVLLETIKLTVMTFMIIAGSTIFSQILSYTGAAREMVEAVVGLNLSPTIMLLAMMLVVFVLGMFIDQISIMMITIPLFMPIVNNVGFDPVWFATLMLINLEIALMTPPFGMLLFVMKGVVSKETKMITIYRSVIPFIICNILVIIILWIFPELVLVLPNLMK